LFRGVVLEHEAARAGAQRLENVFVEVECRENQNPCRIVGGKDATGRLKSVQLRHPNIHQYDGGMEPGGLVHGLETVGRLSDHFNVLLAGEQHAKAGADHRLVVDDEYPDRHCSCSRIGRRVLRTNPPSGRELAVISPP
jgi:hypothetical protein